MKSAPNASPPGKRRQNARPLPGAAGLKSSSLKERTIPTAKKRRGVGRCCLQAKNALRGRFCFFQKVAVSGRTVHFCSLSPFSLDISINRWVAVRIHQLNPHMPYPFSDTTRQTTRDKPTESLKRFL